MSRKTITESEYEIMKILWEKKNPVTLGEILKQLGDKWARNTVGTMLTRLCEKGVTAYEIKGKSYLYYAVLEKKDYSHDETKTFLEKLYDGSVGKMVASLYENKQITEDEIEMLRKIIDGTEKND